MVINKNNGAPHQHPSMESEDGKNKFNNNKFKIV
jgi:hypothetical protein